MQISRDTDNNETGNNKIENDFYEKIIGNNKGIDYLAYGLRNKNIEDMSDEWKQLYIWYLNKYEGKQIVENMLNEAFYANNESYIDKNVANMIYKNADKSVTEIEQYASCAYAHFLNYGLRLRKRKQYEIELPDIGTIFHSTLDMFSKQLTIDKKSWEEVTLEESEAIIDRCVEEISKDYGGVILHSSKRYEYLIERIKNITKRTVKTLQTHIKKGKFVPVGYEVRFDSMNKLEATNILLQDGDSIGIRGAIDRIDVSDSNGSEELVKVIDYKSSGKDFEPALFMEGIQLQLMVYMSVALDIRKSGNNIENVRPAGVFYYTIDNPFVEKDEKMASSFRQVEFDEEQSDAIVEKSILDKLTMTGIVNSDPKVIEQIDEDIASDGAFIPKAKSDVIKLSIASKGELRKGAKAIEDKDFDSLIDKTNSLIREKVLDMKNGMIEKNPYKFGEKTPCEYCDYKSICNFDINLEDNNYKRISKKTMDEILEVLNPEEEI